MAQRWIRLDVAWEDNEWLDELDGTAAGCWPRLLCLVKRDGVRGRCKRPSLKVLARRWRVSVESIEALERAAIQNEALIMEGGDWIVTGWAESQEDPTAAERKRRQRVRAREESRGVTRVTDVTRDTVTDRDVTQLLSRATETPTETGDGVNPLREQETSSQGSLPHALSRVAASVEEFCTRTGSKWKLRRGIDEWADSLEREPRYAGLAVEYEIRRCAEWYESKRKVPTTPDRAIRNWLERSAENLSAGRRTSPFPAGSEAAKPKDELPRRNGNGRTAVDPVAEPDARQLEKRSQIDEWEKENRDKAKIIWGEVWGELERDRVIPERLKEGVAKAVFRRRVGTILDQSPQAKHVHQEKGADSLGDAEVRSVGGVC